MKALIRNKEVILEGFPSIDWNTGAPLTNAAWAGGAYQLVQNYVPPVNGEPESYEIVEPEPEPVVEEETVVINGVTYTQAQLREMLGE